METSQDTKYVYGGTEIIKLLLCSKKETSKEKKITSRELYI